MQKLRLHIVAGKKMYSVLNFLPNNCFFSNCEFKPELLIVLVYFVVFSFLFCITVNFWFLPAPRRTIELVGLKFSPEVNHAMRLKSDRNFWRSVLRFSRYSKKSMIFDEISKERILSNFDEFSRFDGYWIGKVRNRLSWKIRTGIFFSELAGAGFR